MCFCSNKYGSYGTARNCISKCAGNKEQTCGGVQANSVYLVSYYNFAVKKKLIYFTFALKWHLNNIFFNKKESKWNC